MDDGRPPTHFGPVWQEQTFTRPHEGHSLGRLASPARRCYRRCVEKYFPDKHGARTNRIAGRPGAGHIEIAVVAENLQQGKVYEQMFRLGYVRVLETDDQQLFVDAPRGLTTAQKAFFQSKRKAGFPVRVNDAPFVAARTTRTG